MLLLAIPSALAACEAKPAGTSRALASPPAADRRVSWFEERDAAWSWKLADAATGATLTMPLETSTVTSTAYDERGRYAIFLTRGGKRDSPEIVDQKVFVADLEAKLLWEFLAPLPYVHTVGVDDEGPYLIGSTFREDAGALRSAAARILGKPASCVPAVAKIQRFEAGAWRAQAKSVGDCGLATGPTATLAAELQAPPAKAALQSQQPDSLVRELAPEAGDDHRWGFLLAPDGGGLAFLAPSGFFTGVQDRQRVRPVLPGLRAGPATWLDGQAAHADRSGRWLMASFGRTKGDDDFEFGFAVFDMASGDETMRVRDGVYFNALWASTSL